jgi:two-component system, OmpR family, response regulator BaeR
MAETSILIVEDEDKIAGVLEDYLLQAGYRTHRLRRGDEVEPWLARNHADLLLLDLMLPGRDGLEVCRALRKPAPGPSDGPAIIMVTARVEEIDRLLGLEAGADDYVCKPFSPREVVARVRAVLRRSQTPQTSDGLVIDMDAGCALLDGRDLALTTVELRLLNVLAAHPGRIFSRDRLMDAMYPDERDVVDRTVDSHVKKLRRKIEAVRPGVDAIHSVYGMGYKYELEPPQDR